MFDQINRPVLRYSCTDSNIYLILCFMFSYAKYYVLIVFRSCPLYYKDYKYIYIYLNSVFSYIWMYYLFKLCCIFLFNILVLLLLYVLFIFNANKSVMGCKEILVVIWMVNARVVTNFTKKKKTVFWSYSAFFFSSSLHRVILLFLGFALWNLKYLVLHF